MRILLLLAHLTLCHWFTWLNITKNQNYTHIHFPKTHLQSKILPGCWWFYTSAACDACDKYHVCLQHQPCWLLALIQKWFLIKKSVFFAIGELPREQIADSRGLMCWTLPWKHFFIGFGKDRAQQYLRYCACLKNLEQKETFGAAAALSAYLSILDCT